MTREWDSPPSCSWGRPPLHIDNLASLLKPSADHIFPVCDYGAAAANRTRGPVPPDSQVQGVGALEEEGVEGDRQGMQVEALKGPVGQEHAQGRESDRGYPDLLGGYQGWLHASYRLLGGGGGRWRQ